MSANIFKYGSNIGEFAIILNENIKKHILEENEFDKYRDMFRSIEMNYNLIEQMDYDNKKDLLLLTKELCQPLEKYYNKYLKTYENTNITECDTLEYKYHFNKYQNQVSNINFSIDNFILEYKSFMDLDNCFNYRELD